MATAPEPGVTARAEDAAAAQSILTITLRGDSNHIAWNNVPIKERLIVRKATGLPLEAFVGELEAGGASKVGLDSIQVLWWLARRAAGEVFLTFDRAMGEWPKDLDLADDLDVTLDEPDAGSDHPES